MTKETVEKVFTLSSKLERAERAVKQLKEVQLSGQRGGPVFFGSVASAMELVLNEVDPSDAIDSLVSITEAHLNATKQQLADL